MLPALVDSPGKRWAEKLPSAGGTREKATGWRSGQEDQLRELGEEGDRGH